MIPDLSVNKFNEEPQFYKDKYPNFNTTTVVSIDLNVGDCAYISGGSAT